MKKIFLLLAAIALTMNAIAITMINQNSPSSVQQDEWTKADYWIGRDGKNWYKYDKVTMEVKYSTDGKKWEKLKDNKWQDKDGKWFKIHGDKLQTSDDGGNTWTEATEYKWQGGDSKWYKFDSDWALWKK